MAPVVVIFCKGKAAPTPGAPYGAGGLAANAIHSVGVLREMGVSASIQLVMSFADVLSYLDDHRDVTHVVIEAVWTTVDQLRDLATCFPKIHVAVRAHSKMGFLQVEPEAIGIIRELVASGPSNVVFSSNNHEFAGAVREVYGPCLYLPNLYDLKDSPPRQRHSDKGLLKVASFGATRLLKLHPNAALAALRLARRLKKRLEFYVNVDKTPGGDSVRRTMRELFNGLSWAELIEVGWQDSATFKETIATMDLVLQLSATETFCLVAADAVASGVPVVFGPAISWMDSRNSVSIDDTEQVTEQAVDVLGDERDIVRDQQWELKLYVENSKRAWATWLGVQEKKKEGWLRWL